MIVIQIRCYGNWSRVCMLTDARGSQNRFLLRMANKEMFDFVGRKIKIQADTFYRTRRRGLHQSQPVTANEQNGKRPHKPKVPVFSTYVCIIIIWIQLFITWFDDTVESRFFEPPRETKIGRKIEEFEKSGVKFQCSIEERERLLVRVIGRFKKSMFENSGFHCIIKTSNEFYYLIILTLQLLVLLKYKCQKYKCLVTLTMDNFISVSSHATEPQNL